MNGQITYHTNLATEVEITQHLRDCDAAFSPPLSQRTDLEEYGSKIFNRAVRFEAWSGVTLVGLVAAYCNDAHDRTAYITTVSVLQEWQGRGIAAALVARCIDHAGTCAMRRVTLEVARCNAGAIRVYQQAGFLMGDARGESVMMHRSLEVCRTMSNQRDYNAESKDTAGHRYAYDFDLHVMHSYMIWSFEPFFVKGSLLELGSFNGSFTRRLVPLFADITCVEASDEAIAEARRTLGDKVHFVHARFEEAILPRRYDNVVLTHVLEHLDDPVNVLRRINDEWLADSGRLFLVCPNANAPSRQIAVKMGLISHNSAVTRAEAEHGHRRTYALDTLERDAVAAGLKVVCRSGIFFKALANFQWDRLLQTDIISREYLDGCYMLGQQYPDLCASIFLLCERNGQPGLPRVAVHVEPVRE